MASESKGTVLVALSANLAIAVAKGVAGPLSGSSAMLAEAAHSTADTVNQLFLLVAIRADLSATLDSSSVEDFSTRLERELRERHERVSLVLLDATTASGEDAERAERLDRETDRLRETIGAGRA